MKTKKLWVIGSSVALVVVLGPLYLLHANDLGLTPFDLVIGGHPKMDVLRTNTKAAADAFLAERKTDFADSSGGDHKLVVDYSKSSKIRSLGYRSSFYYYCWDIYLPYSPQSRAGTTATVLVQLSDSTPGQGHDLQRFRVLRVMLLDQQGRTTKTID